MEPSLALKLYRGSYWNPLGLVSFPFSISLQSRDFRSVLERKNGTSLPHTYIREYAKGIFQSEKYFFIGKLNEILQ